MTESRLKLWTPLVTIAACLIVAVLGVYLLVRQPAPIVAPNLASAPVSPQTGVPQQNNPLQSSKTVPGPRIKPSSPKKPIVPPSSVIQDGVGNQQTVTQAPITQSNTGGCNQQVVGGNNNTNNCGGELFITADQEKKLATELTRNFTNPGTSVEISFEPGLDEAEAELQKALNSAGISATSTAAGMVGGCEGMGHPGLTISCVGPENQEFAKALNRALVASGIIPKLQPLQVIPWAHRNIAILLKK